MTIEEKLRKKIAEWRQIAWELRGEGYSRDANNYEERSDELQELLDSENPKGDDTSC